MEGHCGNNVRLQEDIAAPAAPNTSCLGQLPLVSSSLCACPWKLRPMVGSCAGKRAPILKRNTIEIAVEDPNSHAASTSRRPQPRARRRTPSQARIARYRQQWMTFITDWWVSFCIIQGISQNVGIWLRQESETLGSFQTSSGREQEATTSDIDLPAPLWEPLVRGQLGKPQRLQAHNRHGDPRCGPLLILH